MITLTQLKSIVPGAKNPEVFFPHLVDCMKRYDITTPERICCFISQLAHESGAFNYVREIASGEAYEGRKDLGNIYPGDGKKFKGRGLIQITGRTNYLVCSRAIFGDDRLIHNPDILATPQYAVESACWYWKGRKLNNIADMPDTWTRTSQVTKQTYTKFQWLTRLINGGLNGYADRLKYYQRARKILIPNNA